MAKAQPEKAVEQEQPVVEPTTEETQAEAQPPADEGSVDQQQPTADAEPAATTVNVRAVTGDYYDPFTKVMYRKGEVVEGVQMDGWMEAQVAAGYIERV